MGSPIASKLHAAGFKRRIGHEQPGLEKESDRDDLISTKVELGCLCSSFPIIKTN